MNIVGFNWGENSLGGKGNCTGKKGAGIGSKHILYMCENFTQRLGEMLLSVV